jgi:hypothetical protein
MKVVEIELSDGRLARLREPSNADLPAFLRALPTLSSLGNALTAIGQGAQGGGMPEISDTAFDAMWALLGRVVEIQDAEGAWQKVSEEDVRALSFFSDGAQFVSGLMEAVPLANPLARRTPPPGSPG